MFSLEFQRPPAEDILTNKKGKWMKRLMTQSKTLLTKGGKGQGVLLFDCLLLSLATAKL